MKRKVLSVLLTGIIAAGVLTGCGEASAANTSTENETKETAAESAESETEAEKDSAERDDGAVLRVGDQPCSLFTNAYVAKELGYIDEELGKIGAKYESIEFASGPIVNEAKAAGEIDIGYMADLPAIIAKSSGQDVQIISSLGYGEKTTALMVAPDSDIKSVADLKGKKIAYVVGSFNQHTLALLLAQEGLTLDDVESINLPNQDHANAILSGDVDASVTCDPLLSKFVSEGLLKVLADGTGIKKSNMVIYAGTDYAKEHPLVIEAYIRALNRADEYIAEHPDEVAELTADIFGVSVEVQRSVQDNLVFTTDITQDDIDEIERVKNFSVENGIIQNDFDINEFINTTFVEAVK